MAIIPPDHAHWFRVDKLSGDRWDACQHGRQKWFLVSEWTDVRETAVMFGSGTYRIIFTAEDRRRRHVQTEPFSVPYDDRPPAPIAELKHAPDATPGPEPVKPADDDPYPDDEPPPQRRPPRRRPAPVSELDMPNMDPAALVPPAETELHPLGQFVYLQKLSQANGDRVQALLVESMRMMVENERARSREHVAQVQAHYEALDANRRDFMQATMAMSADSRSEEMKMLMERIDRVNSKVDELADDEPYDPDLSEAAIAKLSENPNDLERTLAAAQNVIAAIANSPIGAALAERLQQAGAPLADR